MSNGQPDPKQPSVMNPFMQGFRYMTDGIMNSLARIFGAVPNDNEGIAFYPVVNAANVNSVVLGAAIGNQATGSIVLDNGCDFIGTRIIGIETDAADNPIATASFTVAIQEDSSGRLITQQPTHKSLLAGTSLQSVPFAKNWLIPRNQRITFTFTNLLAAACNIKWSVWGYRVFDRKGLNLTARNS